MFLCVYFTGHGERRRISTFCLTAALTAAEIFTQQSWQIVTQTVAPPFSVSAYVRLGNRRCLTLAQFCFCSERRCCHWFERSVGIFGEALTHKWSPREAKIVIPFLCFCCCVVIVPEVTVRSLPLCSRINRSAQGLPLIYWHFLIFLCLICSSPSTACCCFIRSSGCLSCLLLLLTLFFSLSLYLVQESLQCYTDKPILLFRKLKCSLMWWKV